MKCSVFRSSLKEFTYIYLAEGTAFADLPGSLQSVFGDPEFVMDLELTPERRLAYEEATEVRKNLVEQGYHLQLPPNDDPTGLLELPEKKELLT
jgi:uncharacterized protein YcgL (UPF0745 family)